MGNAKHVGRVGALAFALGVGLGLGALPGVATADDSGGDTSSSSGESAPATKKSKESERAASSSRDGEALSGGEGSDDKSDSDESDDRDADHKTITLTARSAPEADVTEDEPGNSPDSPAEWVVVAAARRQIGKEESAVADLPSNTDPTATVRTSNGLFTANVYGRVRGRDTDGDVVTYSASATAKGGDVTLRPSGSFTYRPTSAAQHTAAADSATDDDKVDTFVVTVADGRGGITAVPVIVKIDGANSRPTQVRATQLATNPNSGAVTGRITAVDADGDPLTYRVPAATTRGAVVIDADGSFTYTPTAAARAAAGRRFAPFWDKADSFRATVDDGHGGTRSLLVRVGIAPPAPENQAPTDGKYVAGQADSDGKIFGTVSASDADGDAVTYTGPTTTTKGEVVVNSDGTFTYTPNYAGRHRAAATDATAADKSDTFQVSASDGRGGVTTIPVTVTVTGANTPPTGGVVSGMATDPVSGKVTGTVKATDADNDALVYRGPTNTPKGDVVVNPDGTFSFTPTAAARQSAAALTASAADKEVVFMVTADDRHGGTLPVSVRVPIAPAVTTPPTNRAPVAGDDSATTARGVALALSAATLLANDTDPDSNPLTITAVGSAQHGTTSLTNGTITYTPNGGYHGPDSFSYTISDAELTDTATILVTVAPPVVDPPATQTVTAFPLGGIISGSDGHAYQFVMRVDEISSATSTGVIIFRPDGSSTVSDFVIGMGVIDDATPAIPRQDGSITIPITAANAGTTVMRFATFNSDGTASVYGIETPANPLWADDGTVYLVAPVTKEITAFGRSESRTSFRVMRIGPGGSVTTHEYSTGQEQFAEAVGAPVVGRDGTLYIAINNFTNPVETESGIYLTSHAAVLAIPTTGAATAHPVTTLTGSTFAGASSAVGVALSADGTVFLAAVTVAQGGTEEEPTYTPFTTLLAMVPGGTPTRFAVPGVATALRSAGPRAVVTWVDAGGHTQTSFVGSGGVVGALTSITDFVAGPDGTLYSLSNPGGPATLTATTAAGVSTYALGGAATLDPQLFKFASDGTPFVVVGHEDGTFSVVVPTAGSASPPIPTPSNPRDFSFRVIDDVAVIIAASDEATSLLVIDTTGAVLAHRTLNIQSGQTVGAVTVGSDGTVYIALVAIDDLESGTPTLTTTVWGVSGGDWEELTTTPGAVTGLLVAADGALFTTTLSLSTTGGVADATTTVTQALPPVQAIPVTIAKTLDRVSGAVSGTVTVGPSLGPVQFGGSSSGPLGVVVVNSDGTFSYTPSAAARAYSRELGRVTNTVFFVTATNAAGDKTMIAVSVPLIPEGFPTTMSSQVKLPMISVKDLIEKYGGRNLGSSVGDALKWTRESAVALGGRDVAKYPCTVGDPCGEWEFFKMKISYTGVPPLAPSPNTELPTLLDVYVISILHEPGQFYYEGAVAGFRKMAPGDQPILVKDDALNSSRVSTDGVVQSSYVTHWAVGFPYGTFPEDRFHNRIPGQVGGNMFDNEVSPNDYTGIEQDQYDEMTAEYLEHRRKYRDAANEAGFWTKVIGPIITTPTTAINSLLKGGAAIITAVKLRDDKVQIIEDSDEYRATYDAQESPMFLAVGHERSTPPRVGLPSSET